MRKAAKTARPKAVAALAIVCAALYAPQAHAGGTLAPPTASPAGTFGGVEYLQYDGVFTGATSTGEYSVPYRITAPRDTRRSNGTALVEPPHFATGTDALDLFLGPSLLLGRGFVHASVGYSTTTFGRDGRFRILDPDRKGVFIRGGFHEHNGQTDDEIITDFARALVNDSRARALAGLVARRYITGFSDSSDPVLRLVESGRASGVFDLAYPFTAFITDPQAALVSGAFTGKVMVVNSEFEPIDNFVDRGVAPSRYRYYAVPGTPHVPDLFVPSFWSMTTPASYTPELRGHFLQADRWVKQNVQPAPSTQFLRSNDGTVTRDPNGNTIAVNSAGQTVPRLPYVELGEARYLTGFVGSYDNVRTIGQLGFSSHAGYLRAFDTSLSAYAKAFGLPKEETDAMHARAALCPPLTFTETYRDHYDEFVAIRPCTP